MEAQISMHSYKATNQITYFLNLKITAFGEKKRNPPNFNGGRMARREQGKKAGWLVSSHHPEKTTVYVLVCFFFFNLMDHDSLSESCTFLYWHFWWLPDFYIMLSNFPQPRLHKYSRVFSSNTFMVSSFTFIFWIHVEFILVYDIQDGSNFSYSKC